MDKFFLDKIYNIFFPIKCGYCGEITGTGSYICDKCNTNMNKEELMNRCKFCGTKLFNKSRVCSKCQRTKIYYDELIFFSEYKDLLRSRMLQYKFFDKKYLKNFFAQELSKNLLNVDADLICGVPVTKKRLNERGYNQTNLVAKEIGKILDIEYANEILIKSKETIHQSKLCRSERKINVKNSFKVTDIYKVNGKKILIIDDIFTTGATVNECSKMLKNAGVVKISIATILKKN